MVKRRKMTEFEKTSCKVLGVMIFLLIVIIGLQLSMCHNKIPAPPSDYIDEVNMSNFAKNIDNTVIGYNDRYRLTGYTEIKKI